MSNEVKFETAALEELREACGAEAFSAVLRIAIAGVSDDFRRLGESVAANDFPAARRLGHRLRGLLAQYGAENTAIIAGRIDVGPESSIPDEFNILAKDIPHVIIWLESRL
jgi:HPt (histidine-containing phosphotransfer) domain-containing protein